MKKIIPLILILMIFQMLRLPAGAQIPDELPQEPSAGAQTSEEPPEAPLTPDELTAALTAQTAVLMDAGTGQVLFEKAMDRRMYPASTTKIMTGLLAMEQLQDSEMLTMTQEIVDDVPRYTSHISLTAGEELSVENAMYAMMLPLGNDAADLLAERVAGSFESFVALMNDRADQIGVENTHFVNVHGLHDPDHYTTAYDLALIMREAAKNERLMHYIGTARYTIPPTNLQADDRPLTNQQWMLVKDMWVYNEDVIGGKVGFTDEARYTMVTVGERDGRTLICVVLSSGHDERFYDTRMMLDFGFDQFTPHTISADRFSVGPIPVLEGEELRGSAMLAAGEDVTVLLHSSMDPVAIELVAGYEGSFQLGDQVEGEVMVQIPVAGTGLYTVLARVPLTAAVTLPDTALPGEEDKPSPFSLKGLLRIALSVAGIVALVLLLLAVLLILERRRVMRRRRRRRQQAIERSRTQIYHRRRPR